MIKFENLTFEYAPSGGGEPLRALDSIGASIEAGEFVAILGHNGSGKSTLARHFNALLAPTGGTVWVCGRDTRDPANIWEIRRSVGMVFQNPDNQIIATIVEEDIAFGPENLGVPPEEIRRRVDESLASVKMTAHADSPPHNLSGGQKQRVAIAGVLAMRPACIVLDEPSAMLDPSGRREVMDTIVRLNRESDITVILITHFMEEAARANRVIVMDDGKIVMDDVPRKIFSRVDEMNALGLGVPQVTELAFELKKRGVEIKADVLTIDEFIDGDMCQGRHISSKPEAVSLSTKNCNSPSPDNPLVLELKNVSHIYSPNTVFEKIALRDASLEIRAGEIVAIIGHTGSGKSTLIQHFNALLRPTSGQVFVGGECLPGGTLPEASRTNRRNKNVPPSASLTRVRRRVGLVFQYPEHQLFEVTVYKDVAFGPTRMGLSPEEIDTNTAAALDAVGLGAEFYEKSPFELSGGEKRRAAIAGVLAMRPDVLILDEPAAGLDPRGRKEIFAQIKKMHAELGITIILVSHSMDDAAALTNRIIVMNEGEIVADAPPAEIFARSEFLHEIGLDTPQISRLMRKIFAHHGGSGQGERSPCRHGGSGQGERSPCRHEDSGKGAHSPRHHGGSGGRRRHESEPTHAFESETSEINETSEAPESNQTSEASKINNAAGIFTVEHAADFLTGNYFAHEEPSTASRERKSLDNMSSVPKT
ncbi:MAG: energy-coupling factor transporter ATPase [Defluviitaleaceae bacterium]|nr:energy-coupling factor transporter ATPase [Defluviitaleaceae bacterium]